MTFAEFDSRLRSINGAIHALGQRDDGAWFVNVYLRPKIPHPKVGFLFPEYAGHAFGPDLSTALQGALFCTVTHWQDKTRSINLATGVESTKKDAKRPMRVEDIV